MEIEKLIEALGELEMCACGYHINGEVLGMDCTDFECLMVDAAEEISKIHALQAENAEMQKQLNEFSEFLCHITGGLLSKTNYTAQVMISAAEDYQQKGCGECDLRAENIRWGQVASEQDKAVERLQEENEKLKNAADSWKKKWAGLDKAVKNGSVYRPMQEELNLTHEENQSLKDENEKLRAELERVKQLYESEKEDFIDYACSGVPNLSPYCTNRHPDCVDERGWCRTEKCHGFSRNRDQKEDI